MSESSAFVILQGQNPVYECFLEQQDDFKTSVSQSLSEFNGNTSHFINGEQFHLFTRASDQDNVSYVLATSKELSIEDANELLDQLKGHIEQKYQGIIGNEITSKLTFSNNRALDSNIEDILQKNMLEFIERERKIDEVRNKYF